MSERRPWTDEELGFIQDHGDWTAGRIADELGRSEGSVRSRRWHLSQGRYNVVEPWTDDENDVLLEVGAWASAETLTEKLLGRSIVAIAKQRQKLGIRGPVYRQIDPHAIGARPLLAKSCTLCGRLLQADWFVFRTTDHVWTSDCRACRSARTVRGHRGKVRDRDASTEQAYQRAFHERMKRITEPRADRSRQPYTEQDHEVLADPDLTLLQKALRLGRTYQATKAVCVASGYRSHVGLGEPTDLWVIFNPNEAAA